MQRGGEATAYDKHWLAARVIGADVGTGERESHRCDAYRSEGQHEGQVKATVM